MPPTTISLDLSRVSEFNFVSEVDSESDNHFSSSGGGNGSESGFTSSGGSTSNTNANGKNEIVGKEETRMVFGSKVLVFIVLGVATLLCGAGAYGFTVRSEQEVFISQFEDYATEVIDVAQIRGRQIIDTINAMSVTTTSYVLDKGLSWPYVKLPHFDKRADQVLKVSDASYMSLCPLVTQSQKLEYENWTTHNLDWIPSEYDWRQPNDTIPLVAPYVSSYNTTTGGLGPPMVTPISSTSLNNRQEFYYAPLWQVEPIFPFLVNLDVFDYQQSDVRVFAELFQHMIVTRKASMSTLAVLGQVDPNDEQSWPSAFVLAPIFKDFGTDADGIEDGPNDDLEDDHQHNNEKASPEISAFFSTTLPWHKPFVNVLPSTAKGLYLVIKNSCGQDVTYRMDGPKVQFLGLGDLHETRFNRLVMVSDFDLTGEGSQDDDIDESDDGHHDHSSHGDSSHDGHTDCKYELNLYPSTDLFEQYQTDRPVMYTIAVVLIFTLTSMVFVLYDCLVQRRQRAVMSSAQRSNAIISSLFPEQVRQRLMGDTNESGNGGGGGIVGGFTSNKGRNGEKGGDRGGGQTSALSDINNSKPIADLFPSATIMFADIAGFTAWSSVREPTQVFTLLEKIYGSFDAIAKKRRVFKVETIGDCYVAATGLPETRPDHAELMARFSYECRYTVNKVVKQLEVSLGPDTGELSMRFGIHSGPVTAGVLRGEKSRFQLFGDTVNTASRIESSGEKNMIHLSAETAALLMDAGKSNWVQPRKTLVTAKGKGEMQTYWLTIKKRDANQLPENLRSSTTHIVDDSDTKSESSSNSVEDPKVASQLDKKNRLIDWNVEVLQKNLKKIIAMRDPTAVKRAVSRNSNASTISEDLTIGNVDGTTVLDEVREVITLAATTGDGKYKVDPESVELSDQVRSQLEDYVSSIAEMYHENPFHSFEHASHVTMSVSKLLSRVVTPESIDYNDLAYKKEHDEAKLHEYTYGITSDPLIQFACTLSALIHDVDHQGVPNAQLVKEKSDLATLYKGKSVAEQNSVDIAWDLLMEPAFKDLRDCIYTSHEELERLRQLVVNSVMATDIVDKELNQLRKNRWDKAFSSAIVHSADGQREDVNRKATIVIEHLIQASDVAHTMQHWHVYIKWNERLFHEMYEAYRAGRSDKNPADFWFNGEVGFFDYYIIPLARKLKDCGVFGVSSDEYLNYALANRNEWKTKGQQVVDAYMAKYRNE